MLIIFALRYLTGRIKMTVIFVSYNRECLIWREVSLSLHFRLLNWLQFHSDSIWGRSQDECRMNGGQWRYTPQNPLFSGYNFLSSNLNIVFERRCKEITHCWVLDFLEPLIWFKKSFKMSMTSYTSHDQRYCFTAILQSLWCFRALHFLFSQGIDNTADTGKYTC